MKKFRFPLEALKKVREIEEKQAMSELARVVEKVNEKESARQAAEENYRNEMDHFTISQRESFSLEQYQMYDRYLEKLQSDQKKAKEAIEEIRPELQHHQSLVMEARRKTKVMEILRDRHKAEYDYNLRKQEQKEIAEINAGRMSQQNESAVKARKDSKRFESQEELAGDDLKARKEKQLRDYYRQLGMPDSVLDKKSNPGD